MIKTKGMFARLLGTAAVLALATGVAAAQKPIKSFPDPAKLKYPPLGEIRTPAIDRHLLDNGLVVYLLEDHDFPLVDYRMQLQAGSRFEPREKRGLAAITGEVLRTGGTANIAGDDLDVRLESMGATLESSMDDTRGIVGGSFLSADAVVGLELLGDLLRHPAFPQEKIDLSKVAQRTAIASRNDEPIPIAMREFQQLMFGSDSPYGWYPEYETVAAIERQDLVDYHGRYYHPDRMILTVYGDFERGAMLEEVRRVLGDWPRAVTPLPPDPPAPAQGPTGVFHAEKSGITQATVLFGLPGTLASDPDYAELQLLNQILGEGFTSRLINEIRTKRGLAYAVGSAAGSGWHHPGAWVSYLLIQADSTVTGARLMRAEVEKITREPVTEAELQMAREIVLNQLIFDLSSQRDILNRRAFYEFYGYAPDFLERYQEEIRTLTAQDLLAAAQRHIHPEQMAIMVVGPQGVFDQPLANLGPVTEIDITIPDPPLAQTVAAATPEALARGQEILAAALRAHGGDAFRGVRTLHQKGKGTMAMMGQTLQIKVDALTQLPDKNRAEIELMFGTIVQATDGAQGWMKTPQGVMDAPPEQIEEAVLDRIRSPHHFLVQPGEMVWQALEPREFDGTACEVLYARDAAVKDWFLFVDAASHLVRGMEYRGRAQQGPVQATEILSDYRAVNGVQLAHATRILHDGEPFLEMAFDQVDVNLTIDPALFRKPE